ncbi:MAG: transglutaminase-like domain-containing protein [Phycisphaerae bacterium]
MRIKPVIGLLFLVYILVFNAFASVEKEYFAIFIDSQKVGYAVHTREQTENQVITTDEVNITITRLNMPISISTVETSIETPQGRPLGFESVQNMSFMQTRITGKVNPDGMVDITTITGSGRKTQQMKWPEGALLAEGLLLMQKEKGLNQGSQYSVKIFSPTTLQALETKISISDKKTIDLLGRPLNLTQVITRTNVFMAGEIVTETYVDENFRILKTITPMMGMKLEMMSCPKEFAMSENTQIDLFSKAFITSPQTIRNINSAKSITYYLKPKQDQSEISIPSTDNQHVKNKPDGTIIVTVKPIKKVSPVKIGYDGSDEEVLTSLMPSRFVQSDDPNIKQTAQKVVGNIKDAHKAAIEIKKFVSGYIENKNLSVGYASASEVLQTREGDCTEFAVLTAALCRAAGIPARVAVGIAYVDDFMELKNVFGGHAWTEVYIDGKWLGLDSAFKAGGRGGYGPGHIALATGSGDLEGFFGLLFNLGQFEIEKIEIVR